MNNVAESLAKNAPQIDAAHRQLAINVLAIAVRQVNNKQALQVMIEKCRSFAGFRAALNELFKELLR